MGTVERIHPELNPENMPGNTGRFSEGSANLVSFEEARKRLRRMKIPLRGEIKNLHDVYDYLVDQYTCEKDEEPRWCVRGKNSAGEMAVLYWIKRDPHDRDSAEELSGTMNMFGGETHVEKTEWNGTPPEGLAHET